MASKTRAKSTKSENELVEFYKPYFPKAFRYIGGQGPTDVGGCPFPVEDKSTKAPHFIEWMRFYEKKLGRRFVLHYKGDRRSLPIEFVLMTKEMYAELLDGCYGVLDPGPACADEQGTHLEHHPGVDGRHSDPHHPVRNVQDDDGHVVG